MLHHIVLDLRMLEMEEVPGIIPGKTILLDGSTITANLTISFQYEIIMGRCRCVTQTGNAGADYYINCFHLAGSLVYLTPLQYFLQKQPLGFLISV